MGKSGNGSLAVTHRKVARACLLVVGGVKDFVGPGWEWGLGVWALVGIFL